MILNKTKVEVNASFYLKHNYILKLKDKCSKCYNKLKLNKLKHFKQNNTFQNKNTGV